MLKRVPQASKQSMRHYFDMSRFTGLAVDIASCSIHPILVLGDYDDLMNDRITFCSVSATVLS